jgi:hypothetical protein
VRTPGAQEALTAHGVLVADEPRVHPGGSVRSDRFRRKPDISGAGTPRGCRRRAILVAVNTHTAAPSRLAALAHRWPLVVGLLAAAGIVLGGTTSAEPVAMVVVIAVSCYVAAVAFSRPWMAWAWVLAATVLVVAARLLDVSPVLVNGVAAVALLLVGVVRGVARPALTRQTVGLVVYGLLVVLALAITPGAGLVVAALTLIGHGAWDLWHLRRHRDQVSPSLAEACVALDVPAGVGVLVLASLV